MVKAMEKRAAAAVNVGYSRVVAPVGAKDAVAAALKKHIVECRDVSELVQLVRGKRARMARGGKRQGAAASAPDEAEE